MGLRYSLFLNYGLSNRPYKIGYIYSNPFSRGRVFEFGLFNRVGGNGSYSKEGGGFWVLGGKFFKCGVERF